MTGVQISFFVLAVAAVASALGVIIFKNAVHCALSLILTLLFLALFYLQLGAMFISIVQVLIYAGAIMVLFLFVVTMLASEAARYRIGRSYPMAALGRGGTGTDIGWHIELPALYGNSHR